MNLGWKVLIPISLVWIMLVATVRAFQIEGYPSIAVALVVAGAIVALLAAWFVRRRLRSRSVAPIPAGQMPFGATPFDATPFDAMAGGFPVPPLPGQTGPEQTPPTDDAKERSDA